MIYFDHNGERYHVRHHNEDDSRTVVACEDFDFKPLLRFDSSLNITDGDHNHAGRLTGYGEGNFELEIGRDRHDLGVKVNDWHWNNILQAEVAAAKILLS